MSESSNTNKNRQPINIAPATTTPVAAAANAANATTATESELILRPDGRVYHLNVCAADVGDYVILVGDPARVERVAVHFDQPVRYRSVNREFSVVTGCYQGVVMTALSTGIGCDNMDIVVTELDAAVNCHPVTRQAKDPEQHRKLTLIRLGTCGALQADIPIGSVVVSAAVLGLDGVAHFYDMPNDGNGDDDDDDDDDDDSNDAIAQAFVKHLPSWPQRWNYPYVRRASPRLLSYFAAASDTTQQQSWIHGLTLTANGFYGPQGRSVRLPLKVPDMLEHFRSFTYKALHVVPRVTNLEMEASALYALGQALGHETLCLCVVLANRYAGTFSKNYHPAVDQLIGTTLDRIVAMDKKAAKETGK